MNGLEELGGGARTYRRATRSRKAYRKGLARALSRVESSGTLKEEETYCKRCTRRLVSKPREGSWSSPPPWIIVETR